MATQTSILFGERLRKLRKEAGYSQDDLAKMVNTSKSSISMYEKGQREPGLETLAAFANIFQVDMNCLFEYSEGEAIGRNIRAIREQRGITQEELAHKLGYKSKSSIAKIELGENDIPASKLRTFADALRVHVYKIMGLEESTIPTPSCNTVMFTGRDGSCDERVLTDKQFAALKAVADQFPDADNDQL